MGVTSERDAAGIVAQVVLTLLALWCLLHVALLVVFVGPFMDYMVGRPRLGPDLTAVGSALVPFALAIALLARGPRVLRWSVDLALRGDEPRLAGSGWMATGLPVLAACVLTRSLIDLAYDLHRAAHPTPSIADLQARLPFPAGMQLPLETAAMLDAVASRTLWASLPVVGLAILLFAAAPALTRAWSRWNTVRTDATRSGST